MAGGKNIGTLSAKATLDSSGYTSGTERVAAATRGLFGTIGSYSKTLGLTAAVGGILALEYGIKRYVQGGMDAVKMQERLGQTLGVTQAHAAGMIAIGVQAGHSAEETQSESLKALRHIGELRTDLATGGAGGAAGSSLRALGLDPAEFAALPSWSMQLGILGDRLKGVANAADRAAIGRAILGRGYEALMPQLRMGSEGLERFSQLADHFGVTVGGEARDTILGTARAAREFSIASQLATEGLRNQFTAGFALASQGATRYEAATRTLIELQPELAAAMKKAGEAAGTVMGGIESAAVKILAGWGNIFDLFRSAPELPAPPRTAQDVADDRASLAFQGRAMVTRTAEVREMEGRRNTMSAGPERDELDQQIAEIHMLRGRIRQAEGAIRDRLRLNADQPGYMTDAEAWAAWSAEAEGTSQALTNAIAETTNALQRQNEVYGMSAEEAQRARFAQQGASTEMLAALDKEIALIRERARAERESAALLQMQEVAQTPMDRLRSRLSDIQAQGGWLSAQQRGSLINQAIGAGAGESPLLGSMSANTSETAAILQGAMSPQIDRMAQINATLEAMLEQQQEQAAVNEQASEALDNILAFLNSVNN